MSAWTIAVEPAGAGPTFVRIARAVSEDIRRGRLRAGRRAPRITEPRHFARRASQHRPRRVSRARRGRLDRFREGARNLRFGLDSRGLGASLRTESGYGGPRRLRPAEEPRRAGSGARRAARTAERGEVEDDVTRWRRAGRPARSARRARPRDAVDHAAPARVGALVRRSPGATRAPSGARGDGEQDAWGRRGGRQRRRHAWKPNGDRSRRAHAPRALATSWRWRRSAIDPRGRRFARRGPGSFRSRSIGMASTPRRSIGSHRPSACAAST